MPGHDIIVIGASAGGVEALSAIVQGLPADLEAAIFITLHISAHSPSILPKILSRFGKLKACNPIDGQAIERGKIYVALPDHHLLVKKGHVHISRGPKENGHRPAADTMFRTAAQAYGRRVVGVVLSGNLDDGTAGLNAIKRLGGIAIVQNPKEAMFSGMPRSAVENVAVDEILSLSEIPAALVRWVNELVEETKEPISREMQLEVGMAELDMDALQDPNRPGKPSGFACPDCGGSLWELQEDDLLRFRCRVGHAWSADSLLAEQSDSLEEALWVALRALEESAALSQRLAKRAQERNQPRISARFEEEVKEAKQRAAVIQEVLLKGRVSQKVQEAINSEGDSKNIDEINR